MSDQKSFHIPDRGSESVEDGPSDQRMPDIELLNQVEFHECPYVVIVQSVPCGDVESSFTGRLGAALEPL